MNKKQIFLLLFSSIILFFGCQKWTEPKYKAEDWIPPAGTDSIKQFYTINSKNVLGKVETNSSPVLIANPKDTYLRYIRAVVVSSDQGGNYYKSMVIQDQTGGVELELDLPGLYNFYPVGQKIVLVCNPAKGDSMGVPGLVIGKYNSLPQIGLIYNGNQVGRISSIHFDKYIIKDGAPDPSNVPKPLKNDKIDFTGNSDINKLVRLENVTFEDEAIGKPLSFNDFTTEWKINVPLAGGKTKTVTVRTSNFAKFRNMIIEKKEYNLTGILTIFKQNYQLMIRTKDDIESAHSESIISFDFKTDPMGDGKWSNKSLLGTTQWRFNNASMFHAGNQKYLQYQTAMDDWLLSPEITCSDYKDQYMIFEHQLPVLDANFDAYQIFYTTTNFGNFKEDEWKPLGELESSTASFAWSNSFPLTKIGANKFRIAFRYYAPDKNIESLEWSIKKVEIR